MMEGETLWAVVSRWEFVAVILLVVELLIVVLLVVALMLEAVLD